MLLALTQCLDGQPQLLLDLVQLHFELADLLGPLLVRFEDVRRVPPLPLGARDFVAGGVLLAFEPLHFGNQAAAARFERRELFKFGVRLQTAVLEAGANLVHVIAHVCGVEHG